MKRARAFIKNHWQRAKSVFQTKKPLASATHETSIAADLIADRNSRKEPAVPSVGTSTAGDISHHPSTVSSSTSQEQRTRVESANPAATTPKPVQSRTNTKTISSNNADGHDTDADAASERLPVGFTTVRTHHLDSGAAESSNSSNGLTTASGQTATSRMILPIDGAPVIAQAVAPVAGPVTASNAPLSALSVPAEPPHVKPRLVQQSSGAVIWHEALKTLQKQDQKRYEILDKVFENVSTPKNDKLRRLLELSESKPESKFLLERAKAILPSLGTTRAVAMTITNIDPHKVAPYIVAGAFFIIDVLLGRLTPEDQRKIRNMLFESVNAINEWFSFETNFLNSNDVVNQDVQELEALLPDLYKRALQLLCDLLAASEASWLKTVGNKLSAAMLKWQAQVEGLKDYRGNWIAKRKSMEEKLSGLEHISKVLKWIKSDDDHEQSPKVLSDRTTSEGRHKDSASWILDNQTFKAWSQNFYSLEPSVSTVSDIVSKRVLWVSGSYGVGKTTIVYRVVSELQRLADGQGKGSKDKVLQVIPYFCDTTKRPSYETIVRSIGQKLSLLPDFTIARAAQEFHNNGTLPLSPKMRIKDYEDLVGSLLEERSECHNIALLIDGLNECDPPRDAERLCTFISKLVIENPQIQVLFSSHERLSGSEQLKEHLQKVEVFETAPGSELKDFVKTEIKFRQSELKDSESIFINPEYKNLLEELQQSLLNGAKGMYIWVQVWLEITLPLNDSENTVRLEQPAKELLDALQNSSTKTSDADEQLKAGYQRLWTFGALRDFEEIRKRLFRFVICAFASLELSTITHALRIGIEDGEPSYRKEISSKEIDKLCSNFLSKDGTDHLSWTHDSARDFVERVILNPGINLAESSAKETSMKSNHLLVAETFIAVMRDSDHSVWKELDLDPSKWKLGRRNTFEEVQEHRALIRNAQSSLGYLCRYGWSHCRHAAGGYDIFDPLWARVLREVILRHNTAFALWRQYWSNRLNSGYCIPEEILGDYGGKPAVLSSHILVSLKLKIGSVSDVQFEKAAKAPPERNSREDLVESLVQHAACKSLNGANALHVACKSVNASMLNLMLQAILHRHGGVTRVFELLDEEYQSRTPFGWAWEGMYSLRRWKGQLNTRIVESLLKFENDHSRPNGVDKSGNRALSLCLWLHGNSSNPFTPFQNAVDIHSESSVIDFLNIHKPCNIDFQDSRYQNTALHHAARRGRFQLVKVLVEQCHATVQIYNSMGETPLDVARNRLKLRPAKDPLKGIFEEGEGNAEYARVIQYLESLDQKTKA